MNFISYVVVSKKSKTRAKTLNFGHEKMFRNFKARYRYIKSYLKKKLSQYLIFVKMLYK